MIRTIIVIPCYNEERRFPSEAFLRFLKLEPTIDFLFANDGSTDGTLAVLEALRQQAPERFAIWNLDRNRGKSEAVRQGCLAAFAQGADIVGYWDADLATPLEAIPEFLDLLRTRPTLELICGARVQLLGRNVQRSRMRHYAGRVFATVASNVLGLSIYDTQCGAKLFRATPRMQRAFVAPFQSRWLLDVEILARLLTDPQPYPLNVEAIVCEVPLQQWHDKAGSKVKPLDFPKALLELGRLYRRYFRGTPKPLVASQPTIPTNLFARPTASSRQAA